MPPTKTVQIQDLTEGSAVFINGNVYIVLKLRFVEHCNRPPTVAVILNGGARFAGGAFEEVEVPA